MKMTIAQCEEEDLKVLEIYSGIGGMHYALKLSGQDKAHVVGAIDINPQANLVYQHNFKDKAKLIPKTVEGIKLEDYNRLQFDMILMSPPCQPFTRQGNQKGQDDPRAKSFLSLLEIIPKLAKKPKFILMENVRGFEADPARDKFKAMLKKEDYRFQEFLLSPIQFGIPNSRLRYFLIARLEGPFCFEEQSGLMSILPAEAQKWVIEMNKDLKFDLGHVSTELDKVIPNKESDLELCNDSIDIEPYQLNETHLNCVQSEANQLFAPVRPLSEFVLNRMGVNRSLFLNPKLFKGLMKGSDFVTTKSTRTNCFTKNYGRFMDGSGSILRVDSNGETKDEDQLKVFQDSIRFLSPKEVANLHCFPNDFEYPEEITTIQGWRLIGNSLNCFVVAVLIKLMTK